MESLPSYTIVSGLPSYDDALEQYRHSLNSEIILKPKASKKIFEKKIPSRDGSIGNEMEFGNGDMGLTVNQPESETPDNLTLPLPCPNTGATLTISTISMPSGILRSQPVTAHFVASFSRSELTQFNRKRFSIQSIFHSERFPNTNQGGLCSNCNGQQFSLPIATTIVSATPDNAQ